MTEKFHISDFFYTRFPVLPMTNYLNFLINGGSDQELIAFFDNRLDVQEIIQTSSYNLFNSLRNDKGDTEKISISLKNYVSRMSTRTTPYGLLSNVSYGSFAEKNINSEIESDIKKRARTDMEWLCAIINQIEKENFNQLLVKWNNFTTEVNKKFINTWNTCFISKNDTIGNKSIINSTRAVNLIKENCSEFVSINELQKILKINYPEIDTNVFLKFLNELVDKEFLISNLRSGPLTSNHLSGILNTIEICGYKNNSDLNNKLHEINLLLNEYNKTKIGYGINLFDKIIELMRGVNFSKNYIRIDSFKNNTLFLDKENKQNLLDFSKFLMCNSCFYNLPNLNNWASEYIERYSTTEQLLNEVINDDIGLGLPVTDIQNQIKNIDDTFEKELIYNIQCFPELERIDISTFKSLQSNLIKNNDIDDKTFEICLFAYKKGSKNEFALSPLMGSNKAGSSIGRFLYEFEEQKKFKFYPIKGSDDYDFVEITYYPQVKRICNIISTKTNSRYIIEFGCSDNSIDKERKLHLSDVLINVTPKGIYFKHRKTGRRLIFQATHSTRIDFAPPIAQMLLNSNYYQRKNPFSLLIRIQNCLKKFAKIPRIIYKDITLYEKRWRLPSHAFQNINEEKFIKQLKTFIEDVNIDRFVFLQEYDNRILLDITDYNSQKYIYKTYKKNINIEFVENIFYKGEQKIEKGITECVFFFSYQNNEFNRYIPKNMFVSNKSKSVFLPFQEYIYFKIYTNNLLEDDLINKHIGPFIEKLLEDNKIEKFFFIRYSDPKSHIRLRLKCLDERHSKSNIVLEFEDYFKKNNINHKIVIDTYIPEISRYGGELIFPNIESFFFLNSMIVLKLNKHLEKSNYDKDTLAIITIIRIIFDTGMTEKSVMDFIEELGNKTEHKEEFRNKRKEYMNLLLNKSSSNYLDINKILDIQKEEIFNIWNYLMSNETQITNNKNSILLSMIHMFCNRYYGIDSDKERFIKNIVSKTIYSVFSYEKHQKKSE